MQSTWSSEANDSHAHETRWHSNITLKLMLGCTLDNNYYWPKTSWIETHFNGKAKTGNLCIKINGKLTKKNEIILLDGIG